MKFHSSLKRFFPVIHCIHPYKKQGVAHAMSNVRTAFEYGANGVFLIGHNIDHHSMAHIYEYVRKQNPDAWIGANFLDLDPNDNRETLSRFVKQFCHGLNGLWTDSLPNIRLDIDSSIEVFGGVAFKYINSSSTGNQLTEECNRAIDVVDVVTTSGDKTGSAPSVSKLEEIRKNIGDDNRLAVASGISFENVYDFPMVDDFFVASSITEKRKDLGNQEYLIPKKVYELSVVTRTGLARENVLNITANRFDSP